MELVSGCVECGLAEPESLASLGGSAPGVVDGILSPRYDSVDMRVRICVFLTAKVLCSLQIRELHDLAQEISTGEWSQ